MKGKLEPSERQQLIEEGWCLILCLPWSFWWLGYSLCELYFLSGKNLKEELVTLEEDLLKLTDELQQEAQSIPNMTHPDVPLGGEDSSTVRKMVLLVWYTQVCRPHCFDPAQASSTYPVFQVGKPAEFSFAVKDHVQLGKELDLFDFDAAAEVFFLTQGICFVT